MNVKAYISGVLRKFGFLHLFDRVLFNVQRIKHQSVNKRFLADHPGVAFPPDYFIYETYRLRIDEYYNDGLATSKELISLIGKYKNLHDAKNLKILDWGCGTGRITRHFPGLLPEDAQVYGADYNKQYIQWCRDNLAGIQWNSNGIDPPLLYNEGFFDVVIGLSVFTHLSGQNHAKWLAELHRITAHDGVILVTTQGNAFRKKLLPQEKKTFDAGLLVTRESALEGHRLFSSFQPESYMHSLMQGKFSVLEMIKGNAHQAAQDVWVLRKIN